MTYDLAVIGGGPAGATCAALCAAGGLKVLLLERARFPRDKVCGDCMNPACWPVLERLGVASEIEKAAHGQIDKVEISGLNGAYSTVNLSAQSRGQIAIKRRALDDLLLRRAIRNGVDVRQNTTVTVLKAGWEIHTTSGIFHAPQLVAADGRNSTVARLLGLQPAPRRDRVALQTHFPFRGELRGKIELRFVAGGYCGLADTGDGEVNLCLVARPKNLGAIRAWAESEFNLPADQHWNTITPLARQPIAPAHENLWLVGDAARVVEPFTGEGIYYALASGALAADFLVERRPWKEFAPAHRALYRGRLWINILAREACLHPRIASAALKFWPALARVLTRKVSGHVACSTTAG